MLSQRFEDRNRTGIHAHALPPRLLFDAEDLVEQVVVDVEAGIVEGLPRCRGHVHLLELAAPQVLHHDAINLIEDARSQCRCRERRQPGVREDGDDALIRGGERRIRTIEFGERPAVVEEDASQELPRPFPDRAHAEGAPP